MKEKAKHYRIFRELLKQKRIEKGISQIELGKRLGIRQTVVSKFELGERRLDLVETLYTCEALGIDTSKFIKELKKFLKN